MTLQRVEKGANTGMAKQTEDNRKEVYIVHSDAECIDPQVGRDLVEFLEGTLTGEQLNQFEEHLLRCTTCLADVSNAATISDVFGRAS